MGVISNVLTKGFTFYYLRGGRGPYRTWNGNDGDVRQPRKSTRRSHWGCDERRGKSSFCGGEYWIIIIIIWTRMSQADQYRCGSVDVPEL